MDMTITNNGRVWLATMMFGTWSNSTVDLVPTITSWNGGPAGSTTTSALPCGTMKNTQGGAINRIYYWANSSNTYFSLLKFTANNSAGNCFFKVGTGEAASSDYELDSPITSGVSIALSANRNDKRGTYFVTVTNTGENVLSIGEIGFYVTAITDTRYNEFSGISSPITNSFLFSKAALDTAVEIKGGESKTFDVAITF